MQFIKADAIEKLSDNLLVFGAKAQNTNESAPIKAMGNKVKILYIDKPFENEKGGDMNRSRFIWKSVSEKFSCKNIKLIKDIDPITKNLDPDSFLLYKQSSFFSSEALYQFSKKEQNKFKEFLIKENFDIIIIRFLAPYKLAKIAKKTLPNIKIIIDVDMILSRIAIQAWEQHPCFKNRYFFFEKKKLLKFEKQIFKKPYLFLFSNPLERNYIIKKYALDTVSSHYETLPNIMIEKKDAGPEPDTIEPYILFFGTLNSTANQHAIHIIIDLIYPLIKRDLKKHSTSIHVIGKNALPTQVKALKKLKYIKLIGEIENINQSIKNALFCLLPLEIGSGTRTRILEAAAQKKAVITTTIGTEGLDFTPNEIAINDKPKEIAKTVKDLLNNPENAIKLGNQLYKKSTALYSEQNISVKLQNLIKRVSKK
jgi:glycosyltransferase involved in cell wall biosynthesis